MRFGICLLLALPLAAQPMTIDGTICRMNRGPDRMIIASDAGPRLRVVATDAAVTFEGIAYERADLRPGDRIRLVGNRNASTIRATSIDARVRPVDGATDSLFPSKVILGRFVESDGESMTLNIAGSSFRTIKGRGNFKPGDLVEVGDSITVITYREDAGCQSYARLGEAKEDTAARERAEEDFLQ